MTNLLFRRRKDQICEQTKGALCGSAIFEHVEHFLPKLVPEVRRI